MLVWVLWAKLSAPVIHSHYCTFTYYGSLEIEKLIKIVFWAQIDSRQALEAGKCDFDSFCFAYSHGKLFARSWRHRGAIFFCAIWPGLLKSCVKEVICLSPLSMVEGMPAFRQAVWQCVEGRRATGTCSWVAEGRNRQQFFRHAIRRFQM